MGCLQLILAIIFPPLAVIKEGWSKVLMVFLFTLFGWIPGVIAAIIILSKSRDKNSKLRIRNKKEDAPDLLTKSFDAIDLEEDFEKDVAHYILATQRVDVNQIAQQFEIKIPRVLKILNSLESRGIISDRGKGYTVNQINIADLNNYLVQKEILHDTIENSENIFSEAQPIEDSTSNIIISIIGFLAFVIGFFLPAVNGYSFFELAYFPWLKDSSAYYLLITEIVSNHESYYIFDNPWLMDLGGILFWLPVIPTLAFDIYFLVELIKGNSAFEVNAGFYLLNIATFLSFYYTGKS